MSFLVQPEKLCCCSSFPRSGKWHVVVPSRWNWVQDFCWCRRCPKLGVALRMYIVYVYICNSMYMYMFFLGRGSFQTWLGCFKVKSWWVSTINAYIIDQELEAEYNFDAFNKARTWPWLDVFFRSLCKLYTSHLLNSFRKPVSIWIRIFREYVDTFWLHRVWTKHPHLDCRCLHIMKFRQLRNRWIYTSFGRGPGVTAWRKRHV